MTVGGRLIPVAVKLAKKLKPIQVSSHGPMQIAGPGRRMDDAERSEAWLYRFDNR